MNPSEKKVVRYRKIILVTDSGLGGMSVFVQLANHLKKKSAWKDVSMVYFNAWPEQDRGYNHYATMDKMARVFNNALNAMEKFQPDMILIACNTLSVIYPFTHHSQNPGSKVSGIVNHGVRLIHKNLMVDPDSQVIILGTPTTVAEKSHQKQLVKMGVNPGRIISQGCTDLAGKIERNPFSGSVPEMINANVKEAVSKMSEPKGKVCAALCCTHFGYCQDIFYKTLSEHIKGDVIILNPNQRMADQVMEDAVMEDLDKTDSFSPDIDMRFVSRVSWEPERIDAYIRLLKDVSPESVKALAGYEWNPDLFKV